MILQHGRRDMPHPGPQPSSLQTCIRGHLLPVDTRILVMGILNTTPDSFSDGGRYCDPQAAVDHALALQEEGADLIDIGAESSRPGSDPISEEEELRRLMPVVREVCARVRIPVSVDTTKAAVARRALDAGALMVNDISALRFDPQMSRVIAESGAGLVLMHMQGVPKTMQQNPCYRDVVAEIRQRLGPFDLVMLEVGAFHPSWGDIHLGPDNALVALTTRLHADTVEWQRVETGAPAVRHHGARIDRRDANAAREKIVARDDDDRSDFLRKRGFSKAETQAVINTVLAEEGRPPSSVFDFVQGITAVARGKPHQDARLDYEGRAKRLLEAA